MFNLFFFIICLCSLTSLEAAHASKDYRKHLKESIEKGNLKEVRFLLEASLVNLEESLEEIDNNTPLIEAAHRGKLNIVKYLIESHADIHARNFWGNTALHELINCMSVREKEAIEMIKYMLQFNVDINSPGSRGKTALMYACQGKRLLLIRTLIELGANIQARTEEGETVLMSAVNAENIPAIEYLISLGVDSNVVDCRGHNAFLLSIKNKKNKAFKYFVDTFPVDINQRDHFGATPLMWAAFYQNLLAVEQLLKLGADIYVKTSFPIKVRIMDSLIWSFRPNYQVIPPNSTALIFAKEFGTPDIIQIFEKAYQQILP